MEGNKHGWGWLGPFVSFGGPQPTTTTAHSLPWNPGEQETNRSASSRSLSLSLSTSLPRSLAPSFSLLSTPKLDPLYPSLFSSLLLFNCLLDDDQRLLIDL